MMLGFARRPCNCPWSVPIIRETLWRESHTNRPARTDRRPVRREFRLVIPLEFELVRIATKILGFGLMRSSKVVPSKIPDPLGSPVRVGRVGIELNLATLTDWIRLAQGGLRQSMRSDDVVDG